MHTQQAYIEGFVKRASEYGLSQNEAIELLKSASIFKNLFKGSSPSTNQHLPSELNQIFSKTLGIKKQFGRNHTFKEIGADELDKVDLLMELEEHYKQPFKDSLIDSHMTDNKTIGGLLAALKNPKNYHRY